MCASCSCNDSSPQETFFSERQSDAASGLFGRGTLHKPHVHMGQVLIKIRPGPLIKTLHDFGS